jgi:hypothetical protein
VSIGDTLRIVISALDDAGIPHMIAGSMASSYHGEPRATQDIDLVIDPASAEAVHDFGARLDRDRFYVPDVAAAFAGRETFNVIDTATGWKVGLIVHRDRPYSRTEFARRRAADIDGIPVYIATAEDTVLTKLEWSRLGASERQLRDVAAIVRAAGDALDRDYLTMGRGAWRASRPPRGAVVTRRRRGSGLVAAGS